MHNDFLKAFLWRDLSSVGSLFQSISALFRDLNSPQLVLDFVTRIVSFVRVLQLWMSLPQTTALFLSLSLVRLMKIVRMKRWPPVRSSRTLFTVVCLLVPLQNNWCHHITHVDDFRNEMVSDLSELASSGSRINDRAKGLNWLTQDAVLNPVESEKRKLDTEVENAGLTYRDPPTPKDGNCMFHAVSDQLVRLGMTPRTATELRRNVVDYLRLNPLTPQGLHLK